MLVRPESPRRLRSPRSSYVSSHRGQVRHPISMLHEHGSVVVVESEACVGPRGLVQRCWSPWFVLRGGGHWPLAHGARPHCGEGRSFGPSAAGQQQHSVRARLCKGSPWRRCCPMLDGRLQRHRRPFAAGIHTHCTVISSVHWSRRNGAGTRT